MSTNIGYKMASRVSKHRGRPSSKLNRNGAEHTTRVKKLLFEGNGRILFASLVCFKYQFQFE